MSASRARWWLGGGVALLAGVALGAPREGRAIYLDGVLPGGKALVATRARLPALTGADAACARCHRRSGLGASEGGYSMPPITAAFLGIPREESRVSATADVAPGYHAGRDAFDAASLARAIRDGTLPGGGHLNELMPRYRLDDAQMAALLAHLETLGAPAPGIDATSVDFATIITPDADPAARDAMLSVLEPYAAAPDPPFGAPRRMQHPNRNVGYRVGGRAWRLHVWTLQGPEASWRQQLERHLAEEPVFAVLSGIAGRGYDTVHRFCEDAQLPCLLPNVDLPPDADRDFYGVYFSRGVGLEALLAARWLARDQAPRGPLIQVYRQGDLGERAAPRLRAAVAGLAGSDVALPADAGIEAWRRAVEAAGPDATLVLWARPGDLAVLGDAGLQAGRVLVSGLMGGMTPVLPGAVRERVRVLYPADLPAARAEREALARSWFLRHGVGPGDERIQLDTWVACAATAAVLGTLYEVPTRELLLERFEDMLATGANPGRYRALGLGPGQRYAAKGGYVVQVTPSGEVVPDGDWIVP